MKSPEEFQKLYDAQLVPVLKELEPARKKALSSFWIAMLWLLGFLVGLLIFSRIGNPFALIIPAVPLGFSIYQFIQYGKKKKAYTIEFKEKVIREMVKLMDPTLGYSHQQFISQQEYVESDIFKTRIDKYYGDDLVEGKLGATLCRFSELHHQEKRTTADSKGRTQTHWVTIFKGIFFVADFNKNFIGRTYVLPDAGSAFFGIGKLFEKWSAGRGELVKLENPEFEKLFTVYGTDPVEARYILSTSLMERLVQFRQKAKTRLHLSFINSKLFVALSITKNLFEPNMFSSGVKADYLQEYFRYLALVTGIIEDLNLNLRIWGKA